MRPRTSERKDRFRKDLYFIGLNMRRVRKDMGYTQKEISYLLGSTSETYYRGVESGNKEISLLRLLEIADALGCPCADLLEGV